MEDKKTILVIEDESGLLMALKERLEEDFNVIVSQTGEEGLEQIKASLPDLVLLDLMLPGISGEEVLKNIKEKSRTKDLPVIILSAKGDDATVINCLNCLGADDYLVKADFSLDEVTRKIKKNI
jgi:two-component system phosphate regulon response regulator PhoB